MVMFTGVGIGPSLPLQENNHKVWITSSSTSHTSIQGIQKKKKKKKKKNGVEIGPTIKSYEPSSNDTCHLVMAGSMFQNTST